MSDVGDQLVRFNEEFSKKQKSVEAMWTVISGMLHWRLIESSNWLPETQLSQHASISYP
jgi:hypothetical protein